MRSGRAGRPSHSPTRTSSSAGLQRRTTVQPPAGTLKRSRRVLAFIATKRRPDILTWNRKNVAIVLGQPIRGSDVYQLVTHLTSTRLSQPLKGGVSPALPKGIRKFLKALLLLGIDKKLITNKRRLPVIRSDKWLSLPR